MKQRIFVTVILIGLMHGATLAQESAPSNRKNLIKLNLSTRMLYPVSYVFTYERVVKDFQTFSVTGGYLQFPNLPSFDIVTKSSSSATGFTIGADYRWYMKRENKFTAPRGIYWGPYLGYYQFSNGWSLGAQNSTHTGVLNTDIGILNIGVQLGYQFIVKDRWAFDIIFVGPSISQYGMRLNLNGNFDIDEENQVVDAIINQFPLLGNLIDKKTVTLHGNNSTWSVGYRFTAQVGYKFALGKKKK